MKKVTALTAGILCATGIVAGASAAEIVQKVQSEIRPDFTVKIDGSVRTFKNANGEVVYPMLYEGTTYLPVRAIGELMGKTVYWYEKDKTVELKDEASTVTDADVIITGGSTQITNTPNPQKPSESKLQQSLPDGVEGITIDRAKEIALQKANLSASEVIFTEAKYDYDDGRWICEIEFIKDQVEYSAEILVTDGTVLKWEADRD